MNDMIKNLCHISIAPDKIYIGVKLYLESNSC